METTGRKYLIWDFDGTLAWRPGGWAGAVLAVLQRRAPQVQATVEQIKPYLQSGFPWHAPENAHPGLTPGEWWEDLQPVLIRAFRAAGVDRELAASLAREVRAVYIDPVRWQVYPDTFPTLETLGRQGWTHVMLTNHVPELPILLERLGLGGCFSMIFNSAETGYEKPNPKAFRQVLDWMDSRAQAWMIGDSYTVDILGATEAGLASILVRKPQPGFERYCASLAEVPRFLHSIPV